MKQHLITQLFLTAACAAGLEYSCCLAHAQENIALGKSAAFDSSPNYHLSTDPDDARQITDGVYSAPAAMQKANSIWEHTSTVGWNGVYPIITIDLGKVQPISGVSYSTAGGRAGVTWPEKIYIAVSDDNINWNFAGDLVQLSPEKPPAEGEANFRYQTRALQTKGRYVALGVVNTPFAFVDEIEVYGGEAEWLNRPAGGEKIPNVKTFLLEAAIGSRVRNRLNADIAALREKVAQAGLDADRRGAQAALIAAQEMATQNILTAPLDLKTILPLDETHARIFALHGELLKAQGFAPLTVWKTHRYAWLPLLATPSPQATSKLEFSMLQNQRRSDCVLLTNAGSTPQAASLNIANPPRGAQPGWLEVSSVVWTDTNAGLPVADALLPIAAQNGEYRIEIPAGMTRKVWLTIDSSKLPAGDTGSTLEVKSDGIAAAMPMTISIAKIAMPTPRFSMGMWDYTNNGGAWGLHPKNLQGAISMMRSHHVDTPWASPIALPQPNAEDFDAAGNLTKALDFSSFDQWVSMWPNARRYFVFANVPEVFAGAKFGTPEFNARAGSWARTLSLHMTKLNLKPQQLGLLLLDEARNDEMDAILAAWSKAINAAAPELTLFSDPIWERPDQTKIQEAITSQDILCPQLSIYQRGGAPVKAYFEKLRQSGKELWLYQCTGPVRSFSPQLYYRYNAWHAFEMGATGQGFWSFGDSSGAPTSWQSYLATGVGYEPAFIDADTVHNSVHWESVREGILDYEELAMLRDAIAASKNAALKAQAQKVLDEAVSAITGIWKDAYAWQNDADPELADRELRKVRAMLARLAA